MRRITLGGRVVGEGEPTFVVAEIGINHEGDRATAEELVRRAAAAGVDAVKFQTYVTEKRVAADSPIFDLLKRSELSHAVQAGLKQLAEAEGVLFFSTPFDGPSVDFLESIGTSFFKLASFDLVNRELLRRLAESGKPVIVSRGMADLDEISEAMALLADAGSPTALLHCVSAYPTPPVQANLRAIHRLRERFDVPIGYSDHTIGITAPIAAVAAGARILEKHFTLDSGRPGGDHALSLDPEQMRAMVEGVREMESMLGTGQIGCSDVERDTLVYRRPS